MVRKSEQQRTTKIVRHKLLLTIDTRRLMGDPIFAQRKYWTQTFGKQNNLTRSCVDAIRERVIADAFLIGCHRRGATSTVLAFVRK